MPNETKESTEQVVETKTDTEPEVEVTPEVEPEPEIEAEPKSKDDYKEKYKELKKQLADKERDEIFKINKIGKKHQASITKLFNGDNEKIKNALKTFKEINKTGSDFYKDYKSSAKVSVDQSKPKISDRAQVNLDRAGIKRY